MEAIDNFATAVQANFDKLSTDLDNLAKGIADLDTLIQNLQNSPGTLGPSDQAALDKIVAASSALVTKTEAISTAPPVPPTPPTP